MSAGRDPSGQALAVPATPASAVDGPSGFDPSRDETLNLMAKHIALAGLGTINGCCRNLPPNDNWSQSEWRKRILECIPSRAEDRCRALAAALYSIATGSMTLHLAGRTDEEIRADIDALYDASAAQGMSAFGQDREAGLEAKPASPVAESDAPENKAVDPYALGGGNG